jgi:prepilin-type N-terminal cleavage/methylation domain-containing protein
MGRNRGFSLIEVMVSMLLLMTGLLLMAHSMGAAIETNYRTNQETIAANYAQQKLEVLKSVSFGHSELAEGNHSDIPEAGFSRAWSVTSNGDDEKTITLTLTRPIPNTTLPVRVTLVLVRTQ